MIIERIITRTLDGIDRFGRPFRPYKASYIRDKRFKAAGKSPNEVNLKFSRNMLNGLKLLRHADGVLAIGFDVGTNNDKAAYNLQQMHGKVRDFLGIGPADLDKILREFPLR